MIIRGVFAAMLDVFSRVVVYQGNDTQVSIRSATGRLGLVAILLIGASGLAGCNKSSTPPLLRDATTGTTRGLDSVCPEDVRAPMGVSNGSPELNQRLRQQFPVGSAESKLVRALSDQGFHIGTYSSAPACPDDEAIQEAQYHGSAGWTPVDAQVFWKADKVGRILWTKGFVSS